MASSQAKYNFFMAIVRLLFELNNEEDVIPIKHFYLIGRTTRAESRKVLKTSFENIIWHIYHRTNFRMKVSLVMTSTVIFFDVYPHDV